MSTTHATITINRAPALPPLRAIPRDGPRRRRRLGRQGQARSPEARGDQPGRVTARRRSDETRIGQRRGQRGNDGARALASAGGTRGSRSLDGKKQRLKRQPVPREYRPGRELAPIGYRQVGSDPHRIHRISVVFEVVASYDHTHLNRGGKGSPMRAPVAEFDDFFLRSEDRPKANDGARSRYPGWFWLGYILFGIASWTGVGFGIHALLAAH
jgi:hypothetical protein